MWGGTSIAQPLCDPRLVRVRGATCVMYNLTSALQGLKHTQASNVEVAKTMISMQGSSRSCCGSLHKSAHKDSKPVVLYAKQKFT